MKFYESGRKSANFDAGIENALAFILTAPKFLFRDRTRSAERGPRHRSIKSAIWNSRRGYRSSSGAAFPTTSCSMSRTQGKLKDPACSSSRCGGCSPIRKSRRWSTTSPASGCSCATCRASQPDGHEFPDFDDNLRQAFRRETELFFESIMREDRSVLDLLTADYTFVNERLARHYGIPNVYGSQFRRVTLDRRDARRAARSGQRSDGTSYPNRTSPVLRGKWILENILGTPPPPPPPNVPPLKENDEGGEAAVRARADGRAPRRIRRARLPRASWIRSASRWRTSTRSANGAQKISRGPIDASGQLADGTKVERPRHAPAGADEAPRTIRRHGDGEAADVCARPRPRVLRHAGRARNRSRRGEERLQIHIVHHGHRKKHTISDEEVATSSRMNSGEALREFELRT